MEGSVLLWAFVKFLWGRAGEEIESLLEAIIKGKIKNFFSAQKAKKDREQQYKTHFKRALREKLGAQADRHESSILAFQATNRVSELTIGYCLWTRKGTKSEMLTRYLGDETPSEKAIQMLMAEWYAEKNPALIRRDGEALSVIQAMWYADNQATVSFLSENDRIMLNELQEQLNKSAKEIQDSVNETVIREAQGIQISLHELREWIDAISQQLDKPRQDFGYREKKDNCLLYNANRITFCGREEEMDRLTRFCEDEQYRVRWCQIIGAGGCGKSRLAYEFKYEMGKRGWAVLWFISADDVERFSILPEQDTLVIADYAQTYCASLVNNLLRPAENNNPAHKLRVILMDRQKIKFTGGADASDIHDTASDIFLPVLADKNLLKIMDELARVKGKSLKSSERRKLLDRLKEIDPGLCRPLYALMLTAIACEGSMDAVSSMSAEDVLDHILKHDFDIMLSNLSNFYQRNASAAVPEGTLESDLAFLRELQTIATVNGNISLEDLENLYPSEWQNLQAIHETVKSRRGNNMLGRLLASVGLLEGNQILAVRPDILGERLVWKRYEEDTANLAWMFPNDFYERLGCMMFLFRFVSNYGVRIPRPSTFWTHMEQMKKTDRSRKDYAAGLVNLVIKQNVEECEATVKELKELWESYQQDVYFSAMYVAGLFNFSVRQKFENYEIAIPELKKIWEENPKEKTIANIYAEGLFNAFMKQDYSGQETTMEAMRRIWEVNPKETRISILYASRLVDLSFNQNLEKCEETVEKLRILWEENQQEMSIAVNYAQGLLNLTSKQDFEGCKTTVKALEELWETNRDVTEIAVNYASGLFNLINRQECPECEFAIERLKTMWENNRTNAELAIAYSKGLVVLSQKQSFEKRESMAIETKKLCDAFKQEPKIAVSYAMCLFSNIFGQDFENSQRIVEELKRLFYDYPKESEIAIEYAKGLSMLVLKSDVKKAKEIVDDLRCLWDINRKEMGILIEYAGGLVNLAAKPEQELEPCKETVTKLQKLWEDNSEKPEIAVQYAKGLVNLSCKQNREECNETIYEMGRLTNAFPQEKELYHKYSLVMQNYIRKT